jgi:hypothetical protein
MAVAERLNAMANQRAPGELERGPRSLADPKDFRLTDRLLVPVLAAVLRFAHPPGAADHAIADRPLPDRAPGVRMRRRVIHRRRLKRENREVLEAMQQRDRDAWSSVEHRLGDRDRELREERNE